MTYHFYQKKMEFKNVEKLIANIQMKKLRKK